MLLSGNPFVGAEFFDLYVRAFIKTLLGYDPNDPRKQPGILGKVKAYYGCVEAQGRGSLHCHMLVWIEGGLNPNEIRERITSEGQGEFTERLLKYLDDIIVTDLPAVEPGAKLPHPCLLRHVRRRENESDASFCGRRERDLRRLVEKTQVHTHSFTCYKYWKGGHTPKTCRFDLDEKNVRPETVFDPVTGEITLRQVKGLVNPYNPTILSALRCNMDIKFIGSGTSAKAILYYVSDYITKSQLKAHVAFGALDAAVQRLGSYSVQHETIAERGKRLLNRCAYTMLSHQELSAQQVAAYLMGYGDYYSSHQFRPLFWTSFEKFIDDQFHSKECYPSEAQEKPTVSSNLQTEQHQEGGCDSNTTAHPEEGLEENDESDVENDDGSVLPDDDRAVD
ncbi:hypothetical protein K435DRAFT_668842, partial [Dendrothele bispora CBS 962.96]